MTQGNRWTSRDWRKWEQQRNQRSQPGPRARSRAKHKEMVNKEVEHISQAVQQRQPIQTIACLPLFGTSHSQLQGTVQDNCSGHTSALERAARLISEASPHDTELVSLIHARVSRAKLDLECKVPKPERVSKCTQRLALARIKLEGANENLRRAQVAREKAMQEHLHSLTALHDAMAAPSPDVSPERCHQRRDSALASSLIGILNKMQAGAQSNGEFTTVSTPLINQVVEMLNEAHGRNFDIPTPTQHVSDDGFDQDFMYEDEPAPATPQPPCQLEPQQGPPYRHPCGDQYAVFPATPQMSEEEKQRAQTCAATPVRKSPHRLISKATCPAKTDAYQHHDAKNHKVRIKTRKVRSPNPLARSVSADGCDSLISFSHDTSGVTQPT